AKMLEMCPPAVKQALYRVNTFRLTRCISGTVKFLISFLMVEVCSSKTISVNPLLKMEQVVAKGLHT
ncbi:hypothetical protein L9F63_003928, partial [Diploptera punctata]